MACMVVVMSTALLGVSPQLSRNSNRGYGLVPISLLTLFTSIFAIQSGDFVYTALHFQTGRGLHHFEQFYIDLWNFNKDILFWRIVVFGSSVLLLISTIKNLNVNIKFACFIFVITKMFYFGQMRNMFGFMVEFFCIAILFNNESNRPLLVRISIAVIGIWLSTFLHRSMWMYCILLIPAYFLPLNKKCLYATFIAFPILYASIFSMSYWFLGAFGDSEIQSHALYYTDTVRESTLMKTLIDILMQTCYIFLLSRILISYNKGNLIFPPVMLFLTRYAYLLMYIGLLFYGQGTGGWLYERFIQAGEISLMFVMMWFFYLYPRTKGVKLAFLGLIFCILYQMLYICAYANNSFINRFNTISF